MPLLWNALTSQYEKYLRVPQAGDPDTDDLAALRFAEQDTALRLAVLAHKRATVIRLREEDPIDDVELRRVQTRLDQEETRLLRHEAVD